MTDRIKFKSLELKTLRDFVDRSGIMFEEGQGEALAWGHHAAPDANRSFLAAPELVSAIGALAAKKFA